MSTTTDLTAYASLTTYSVVVMAQAAIQRIEDYRARREAKANEEKTKGIAWCRENKKYFWTRRPKYPPSVPDEEVWESEFEWYTFGCNFPRWWAHNKQAKFYGEDAIPELRRMIRLAEIGPIEGIFVTTQGMKLLDIQPPGPEHDDE